MKNKKLIIGIFLFALISCGHQTTKSNNEQTTDSVANENSVSNTLPDTDTSTFDNAKAIEMLKEFYKSYVHEVFAVQSKESLDDFDSVFYKYTTENLHVQLNTEVDEDWVLFPKNCSEDALQTMSIRLISNDSSNFCVTFYHYDDENNKITDNIKIHIVKENNEYKIDRMIK